MTKNIELQREIMTTFWNIFRRHANITQNDEWEPVIKELDDAVCEYSKTNHKLFAQDVCRVILNELTRISRE